MNGPDDREDDGAPAADKPQAAPERVGYRCPPRATRFAAGASGNPKGRPKARKSLKQDLEEELSERITIREGDKTVRITKQRALLKSTIARAIKGERAAQAKALDVVVKLCGDDDRQPAGIGDAPEDAAILEAYVKRQEKSS